MGPHIGVWAGAQRLLGIESSWATAAQRLRAYTLVEVLEAIGRLDAVLVSGDSTDPNLQFEMCRAVFGAETAGCILRRLALMELRDRGESGSVPSMYIMFGPRSLAAVLQVAVHACAVDSSLRTSGLPLVGLGEALLIVNDLLEETPQNPSGGDVSSEEGLRKWMYYLSVLSVETGSRPSVQLVVRTADLFLSNHENLRGHPDYVPLESLFEEATGVTVQAYFLALVYLLGTLFSINIRNIQTRSTLFSKGAFRGEHLHFSPHEIEQFFSIGGVELKDFIAGAREAFPKGTLKPYFQLPLEQSPLVRDGEIAVCASVRHLERKLTTGLYHVLLNARMGPANRQFRDRLLRFFGHVFEDVVSKTCERIVAVEASRQQIAVRRAPTQWKYYREEEIRSALARPHDKTPALCDGVLVLGDTVVLIECKARMLSLRARAGEGESEFFQRLREIAVRGLAQIHSTLRVLLSGDLTAAGISFGQIRHVFPAVVSLQDVFMNTLLRKWIERELEAEDCVFPREIGRTRIYPFEILDLGDLDWLELAVEQGGTSLSHIFARKHRETATTSESVASWAYTSKPLRTLSPGAKLRYHSERFKEVSEAAHDYYRQRSSETDSSA